MTEAHKAFGRTLALGGVDLVVGAGEVVALVGPNGSGKTTLLHLAAGLERPDRGMVEVVGERAGCRLAREATALVPDVPRGLDELTVREHLQLACALAGVDEDDADPAPVVGLGLHDLQDRRIGVLSRGQRRRVELAAALRVRPTLLLVDEATATLDRAAATETSRLLRARAADGGGVLLATHDLRFVESVADRVHLLRGGRIVGGGPGRLARALTGVGRAADAELRPAAREEERDAALAR